MNTHNHFPCASAGAIAIVALLSAADLFGGLSVEPHSFRPDLKSAPAAKVRTVDNHPVIGGEALVFELPVATGRVFKVTVPLGDVDMFDAMPCATVKIALSRDIAVSGRFFTGEPRRSALNFEGVWRHQRQSDGSVLIDVDNNDVARARSCEASGMNSVQHVSELVLSFNCWGYADSLQPIEVAIGRFSLGGKNSWAGTERDRRFRNWLKYWDNAKPDYSDSAWMLGPPKEGRLKKPLTVVEAGLGFDEGLGEGMVMAEIVYFPDFYGSVKVAANELQHWIEKISGEKVPIRERKPSKGDKYPVKIFLNSPFAEKKWADDVAWLRQGADTDGYFIRTLGNKIYIGCAVPSEAGPDEIVALGMRRDACANGVYRGVVALLENNSDIIFAGRDEPEKHKEFGTIYTRTGEFVVRWADGRERPATNGRGWFSDDRWGFNNRGNITGPFNMTGHADMTGEMIEFLPDEDPYRVWDGNKRIVHGYYNGQICLGAPDALEKATAHVIKEANYHKRSLKFADPTRRYPIVSKCFFNEDNWRVCICDKCTAPISTDSGMLVSNGKTSKDSMTPDERIYRSTQFMMFINQMADNAAKTHPDVPVIMSAYLFQIVPPHCKISKNVGWIFAPYQVGRNYFVPIYHPANNHIHGMAMDFLSRGGCKNAMRGYDYHAFDGIDGISRMVEAIAEDYAYSRDVFKAKCMGSERSDVGSLSFPFSQMNGWLYNRVSWSADINEVQRLRKYYIRRTYREAAPIVERWILPQIYGGNDPQALSRNEAKAKLSAMVDEIKNESARINLQALIGAM